MHDKAALYTPQSYQYIALDIGNTRVKLFNQRAIMSGAFAYKQKDWLRQICRLILSMHQREAVLIAYSSVQPQRLQQIQEALKAYPEIQIIPAINLLEQQKLIDFSHIQGMGDDRRLGLAGGLQFSDFPFITVDCGTAVTINIVDESGICRGGMILPGFATMARALHSGTAQLPEIIPMANKNPAGINTSDALTIGIGAAIAGAVREAVRRLGTNTGPVIITGGDAQLLFTLLSPDIPTYLHIVPNLIARGIICLMEKSISNPEGILL
jgi:type III pantothenate kinase